MVTLLTVVVFGLWVMAVRSAYNNTVGAVAAVVSERTSDTQSVQNVTVWLRPMDLKQDGKGPYHCATFRAFPHEFYCYADPAETGDAIYVDMRGVPYAVHAWAGER